MPRQARLAAKRRKCPTREALRRRRRVNADAASDGRGQATDQDRQLALKNRANPDIPDPGDVAQVTDEPREFTANDPMKGRRSRAAGGYLGAVAGARFWAEHQIIINQIKQALQLYWAEKGDYPQTQEEFMQKIIKLNQIQLPELMADEEYVYVPEEGINGLQIRKKQSADSSE